MTTTIIAALWIVAAAIALAAWHAFLTNENQ